MKNPNKLWSDIVVRFSQQSKCLSRQVGAIIVKDDSMVAEGWNSPPKGSCTSSCTRPRCNGDAVLSGSAMEQAICVHAEANALANCAKRGINTESASIYVTHFPCVECCKLIISAGIRKVFYKENYPNDIGRNLFYNAEVAVEELREEEN